MAKKLTRFILFALLAGVITGWVVNATIDDGTPVAAAQLKDIAGYFSIVTALFLRLIKMIIAPLVFSTLVVGIAIWATSPRLAASACGRLPGSFSPA